MAVQLIESDQFAEELRYWIIQHETRGVGGEEILVPDLIKLKNAFKKERGISELDQVVREAQAAATKICLETEIPPYKAKELKPSPELARWLNDKANANKKDERRRKRRKDRHRDRNTLRRRYPTPASACAYCK